VVCLFISDLVVEEVESDINEMPMDESGVELHEPISADTIPDVTAPAISEPTQVYDCLR
jgi:hypothetical protein